MQIVIAAAAPAAPRDQWTDDVASEEDVDAKGLLIANAFIASPPQLRGALIAPDTLALAGRWGQSVVSTAQLFAAVVADQSGGLDCAAFWDTLMESAAEIPE